MKRLAPLFSAMVLMAVVGAGCFGETQEEDVCAPNRTISCACPGLTIGVQTCNAEGTGYSACEQCPDPSTGGGGGEGGSGATGGGGDASGGGGAGAGAGGTGGAGGSGGAGGAGGTGGGTGGS